MRHCAFKKFGKGNETILFFPAAGFSGMEGEIIADFFQDDYQVYLCDTPGYGKSSGFDHSIKPKNIADWLITFLDEEKREHVHLIGHSAGGFVCLCAAYFYPNRVKSLTLLDTCHFNLPRLPSEMGKAAICMPLISLLSRIFKRKTHTFSGRFILPAIEDSEANNSEDDFKSFCQWMHLDPSNQYVAKGFYYACLPLKQEALPFHLCHYQTNVKKMLSQVRQLPVCLCYATYKGIDHKREQFEQINAASFTAQSNSDIVKVPGAHYVLWAKESPLPKIATFIKSV
ncbi:alpha/beta fold hydrolase [Sporolactobacillus sp. STCC-11]|uniref:alpha/beta fold hydrolase n=1 Tax=Sporolactobacillus caesalpiniae TaxID=3230362 RepID=UPI003396EE49